MQARSRKGRASRVAVCPGLQANLSAVRTLQLDPMALAILGLDTLPWKYFLISSAIIVDWEKPSAVHRGMISA